MMGSLAKNPILNTFDGKSVAKLLSQLFLYRLTSQIKQQAVELTHIRSLKQSSPYKLFV